MDRNCAVKLREFASFVFPAQYWLAILNMCACHRAMKTINYSRERSWIQMEREQNVSVTILIMHCMWNVVNKKSYQVPKARCRQDPECTYLPMSRSCMDVIIQMKYKGVIIQTAFCTLISIHCSSDMVQTILDVDTATFSEFTMLS